MEGVVRLIVKAPNQQIEDQIVKCEIGWTVGRLKEYLANVYPSKPKSSEQKLIYSGQLLNDASLLRDILHRYGPAEYLDESYTVHLVCSLGASFPTDKVPNTRITNNRETMSELPQQAGTTDPVRNDRLQNRSPESGDTNSTMPSTQLYSTQQYYNQLNNQQMALMQQAYTHYLAQYMQLMAAQGIQFQSSIPYIQPLNPHMNAAANNNNNEERVAANGNAGIADPAEVNGPNNNGAVEDRGDGEAGFNRDWLDFFHTLSRVIVLFSIVYFYSSPHRFLIVTFLGFTVYLYQVGFFRVPVLLVDNNNGRADNNNQILQNEAVGAQGLPQQQPPPAQTPPPEPDTHLNPNEENEAQRPGALAFAWTFFSSFFASLIPDQPNVI